VGEVIKEFSGGRLEDARSLNDSNIDGLKRLELLEVYIFRSNTKLHRNAEIFIEVRSVPSSVSLLL